MLDNTIVTKFELSEREKILKRLFFKREDEPGKKYLFSRPQEKANESVNNKSNMNNSQSVSLEQNQNSKISTQLNMLNINNNDNLNNNETFKSLKQTQTNMNQNMSNSIPDIKNITQDDMNKFYAEAANYLPKGNGGMSPEQINLLMHQNQIMQRNVDALQETNRSLQDFIIYTMKKDNIKSRTANDINGQEPNGMGYEKLNKILKPLYNQIDSLQSQVKELNQKKRENEINDELDGLILKNQNNKYNPIMQSRKRLIEDEKNGNIYNEPIQSRKRLTEDEKTKKLMMKTLTNLTEEMKKIGSTVNEKMQKVLEDSEKDKLTKMVGVKKSNSTFKSFKAGKGKNSSNIPNNNIIIVKDKENGMDENESLLKHKLDKIDYESFKSDLIDIGHIKDGLWEEYKSGAPEFPKLTKPKSKIKFSYNLDKELDNIMKKIDSKPKIKSKIDSNLHSKQKSKNKNPSMKEKVSNAINKDNEKEKRAKSSNFNQPIKRNEKKDDYNKKYMNVNEPNNINKENDMENDYEDKMKELNKMSVVDQMNLYKERMAQLSGNYEVKENNKNDPKQNDNKNLNPSQNNINDLGSNHSGVTFQTFNNPSSSPNKNKNKYNPPKVKYGVFHGQKGVPNYNPNFNEEPKKIIIPEIIQPDPNKLQNLIQNTLDNYLVAAFSKIKPPEPPKIDLNNENQNQKPPNQINAIQRVIEREYVTNQKEVKSQPQPIIIKEPSQPNEQNKELIEKFANLAEKLTNLEEKISKQISEQKNIEKKIIIDKKERPKPQEPDKKVILPNTDLISKLVIDKIKKQMNVDINLGRQQNPPVVQPPKKEEAPRKEEQKEEKIDIFDENQNKNMEELDEMIKLPHQINLEEYEVSHTSSYLSESIQKNNLNNNLNQINYNYNKININVDENYNYNNIDNDEMTQNDENNDSRSKGEIRSNNGNSSQNDEDNNYNENYNDNNNNNSNNNNINYNSNRNKGEIDLLNLKNLNEHLPNNINILQYLNNDNIVNIPQMDQNNNYNSYLNFLNNNNNINNINNINNNKKNIYLSNNKNIIENEKFVYDEKDDSEDIIQEKIINDKKSDDILDINSKFQNNNFPNNKNNIPSYQLKQNYLNKNNNINSYNPNYKLCGKNDMFLLEETLYTSDLLSLEKSNILKEVNTNGFFKYGNFRFSFQLIRLKEDNNIPIELEVGFEIKYLNHQDMNLIIDENLINNENINFKIGSLYDSLIMKKHFIVFKNTDVINVLINSSKGKFFIIGEDELNKRKKNICNIGFYSLYSGICIARLSCWY